MRCSVAALMFLIVFESSVPEPQQVKRKCGGREFSRFCFQVNQTLLILPCQGPTSWGLGQQPHPLLKGCQEQPGVGGGRHTFQAVLVTLRAGK